MDKKETRVPNTTIVKTKKRASTFYIDDVVGTPSEHCHKCGGGYWLRDAEPLTWGCIYCGNRAYYIHGVLRQQIDSIVAATSPRAGDYVYSADGKKIVPKLNEDIKRIRFMQAMDKKAAQKKLGK